MYCVLCAAPSQAPRYPSGTICCESGGRLSVGLSCPDVWVTVAHWLMRESGMFPGVGKVYLQWYMVPCLVGFGDAPGTNVEKDWMAAGGWVRELPR